MRAFKILLFLFLATFPAWIHAEFKGTPASNKVLVLVSYHTTHPWASSLIRSMTDATKDLQLDYIVEELNAMRVPDPDASDRKIRHQLDNIRAGKYKMIVAVNDTALRGLLKYAKELPPELPVVFAGCEMVTPDLRKLHPNMTGVVQQYDTAATVRTARKLYPKTRQIAILYDSSPASIRFAEKLKTTLPEIPGVQYLYIGDSGKADSLHDTLQKIAELPENSIVIVSPWRGLSSRDYQSVGGFSVDLSHASRLPYFVSADALIGHGAVGGYVSVAADHGQQTADVIRKVHARGKAADIPPVTGRSIPVFDYRVMTDHHLDFKQLPPDSRLLNEPPGLWQRHSALVIGAGVLLGLLLTVSGGLVIYLTAVRRTMKRSRELYSALPGRIGVVNSKEQILYLNSKIVRDGDGRIVEYFREIPDIDYPKLSAAIADVFATGQPVTLEYEFRSIKRIMTIAPIAPHLFGEDAVVWFSHDNTELQEARHQAEDFAGQLQKTTRMWNILINSLPIHIFAKDAGNDFRYLFSNKTRAEFYGAEAEELNGKNDFDLFPAEVAAKLRNDDEANMADIDKSEESVIELTDSAGKKHMMHAVQTPFIDEDGTRLLLGAMIDVTELEESRRVLEVEHALRDEMIQFIPFIFFAKDADHDFRYVMGNRAFEQFVGAEPGTIKGKTSKEVFVESNEAGPMPERDREVIEKGDCIQFAEDLTSADGQVHHMLTYKKFFRGGNGRNLLLGASFDVTGLQNAISEAKKSNEELQDILSLYNTLLDNMRAFVFTKDIDNDFRFTSCNQYCCELMGRTKEDIIGKCDFELFHEQKEAAAFLAADREGADKGETECVLEYTGMNGIRRIGKFFRKRIQLSRNRNWLFLLVVDITEQEEMKRRAEENAEWLRRTLNSIGDGVITTDATGNIVMMNPVSERMIGVNEKEVIGLPHDQIFKIVGSYDGEPMQSPVLRTLRTGTIVELANHTDLLTRNGRRYHIADSAAPICDKENRIIGSILVFRDVTEEYDSRDKLRNAITSLEYASELTNSAAFVYEPATGVMTGSKYLHNLWPIDKNNIAAQAEKWVHPDDLDTINHMWDSLKSHETEAAVFNYRAVKDGALHYYRLKSAADHTSPGKLRFVGVIQDITEITANAMKLNDTIALWEQVINTIPIMFFVKDADNDFRYLLCNREFADFHGLTLEDIIGKNDGEVMPRSSSWVMEDDRAVLESSKVCNFERRMTDCRGISHLLKIVKKSFVEVNGRRLLIGASSDISELDNVIQNEKAVKESLSNVMLEPSFSGAFERIAFTLSSKLGCDRILLAKCNEEGKLRLHCEWHTPEVVDLRSTMLTHHYDVWDLYSETLRTGKLIKFDDFNSSGLSDGYHLSGHGYVVPASLIVSPIFIDDQLWGALFVSFSREKKAFSFSDEQLMRSMSDIIELTQVREKQQSEIKRFNLEKQIILDHVNIPIWLHDGNGELLQANTEVAKIAGIPVEELDTKTNWEIFCKEFPAKVERPVAAVIKTHKPIQMALPFDGRDYMVQAHPVFDENQKLIYIVKSAIDVTELNELVQAQQVVSFCLETFFAEADIHKALSHVIKAICKHMKASCCFVMNFDMDKSEANTIAEYVRPGGKPVFGEVKNRKFNPQEPWFDSFTNHELISMPDTQTPEAAEFCGGWYGIIREMKSIHVSGIYLDGKFWGDIGITFNDQNYVLSEDEKKFIRTAGRMVGLFLQRMKAQEQIISALNQARAADKAKSFFIASVSHEIRTPLNAVIGFAELLRSGGVAPKDQKDYLDSIAYSGNALLQLINDVLDLSKLEADQMQIVNEPAAFAELAWDVIHVFAHTAAEKDVQLKMDIEVLPILEIDKLRIRQILFNLIGNAVKFTSHGTVSVKAAFIPDSEKEGTLKFEVADTGIGIAKEDQAKLMEPFVQLTQMRGTNAANNGTGLGLSICKRLAEKMNGTLELNSIHGQGSIFRVILPHVKYLSSQESTPETAQPLLPSTEKASKISVLLVDDVEMNLKVMTAMCKKAGVVDILCASSGNSALDCLKNRKVDLVLTDMWMPGMNGAELALEIHRIPACEELPVIAVTADVEAQENFPQKNFAAILFKPITLEKLKHAIAQFLG